MIYKKFEKEVSNIAFDIEQIQKYRKKVIEINEKFKQALFKKYDVTDNPKAEKCYEIAWDRGHSCGYSEVELIFDDMVELIK